MNKQAIATEIDAVRNQCAAALCSADRRAKAADEMLNANRPISAASELNAVAGSLIGTLEDAVRRLGALYSKLASREMEVAR